MADELDSVINSVLDLHLDEIIANHDEVPDEQAYDFTTTDFVNRHLPIPSDEQQAIVESARDFHLVIDSVAGSGKTTTIFHVLLDRIAAGVITKERPALILTYNSKLKAETRSRARLLDVDMNLIHIHTYHSFGFNYINRKFTTDIGFIDLKNRLNAGQSLESMFTKTPPHYSFIFMDEFQDLTSLLFVFIKHFIAWARNSVGDTAAWPRLICLGDQYQCIYRYQGADERFLADAHILLAAIPDSVTWRTDLKLRTSYRITRQMADFMNYVMLGETDELSPRALTAIKDGPKPMIRTYGSKHVIGNEVFKGGYDELDKVIKYLRKDCGIEPHEIFILAPSVRPRNTNHNPLYKASKLLTSKYGDLIYIPNNDDAELSDQIIDKKLVFSTFHQSKGLERRAVIVLGFDESYLKYYCSEPAPIVNGHARAHNTLYVAASRAKEQLILFKSASQAHLPYVNGAKLPQYADIDKWAALSPISTNVSSRGTPRMAYVTDLTRHQRSPVVQACRAEILRARIRTLDDMDQTPLNIKSKVLQFKKKHGHAKTWYEDVSDINGMVVTMYYEYRTTGTIGGCNNEIMSIVKDSLDDGKAGGLISAALRMQARKDGLDWKLDQFRQLNWIDMTELNRAFDRMHFVLTAITSACTPQSVQNLHFEHSCGAALPECTGFPPGIEGRIDVITGENDVRNMLWELKCVSELKDEHYIQLALYAYIMEANDELTFRRKAEIYEQYGGAKPVKPATRRYILYNVFTHEGYEIRPKTPDSYKKIVALLLCNKYHKRGPLTDEDFKSHHSGDFGFDLPLLCELCIE